MKQLLITLLSFSIISCAAFSSLTSNTTIEAGKQFVLGDNEHGAFNATLRNDAPYNLIVYTQRRGATLSEPVVVKPSEKLELWVGANETVFIQNKGKRTVQVYLKVAGDTGLGMGYKPVTN